MLADFAKESVFDRIPLGGAGGVMADGHRQWVGIDQPFLKGVLPESGAGAVAAAAIGKDKQFRRPGVASPSLAAPPPGQSVHGERGRVMGGANQNGAAIGLWIIK